MVSNVRASMGVGVLVGLTLSVLLMLMATAPAQAHTLTECQAQINQLKSLTDDATFLGKKATTAEANLLFKLDEANDKLVEGKYQDAIDKLTNFQNTVIALDEGDKIDPDDASELIAAAEEAKDCVDGLRLQAQATTAA